MLNYSFVNKNETKPYNMGNVENSSHLETAVVILNVPLMFASITGNALVLAAILKTPSLRSLPSNIFLCSLSITDFLVGLVVQPVYIIRKLNNSTSEFFFKATGFMTYILCGVSLTTITAISLDRLFALHYHMTYPNLITTKRAIYASASLWFVSIMLSCLGVWITGVYFLIVGVLTAICFVISAASYIKIYFIVRHHQIQIHAQQQAVNNFSISVNIPDSNNMLISKKHALKTFMYYACMVFCYLPYLSVSLLFFASVIGYDRLKWSFVETLVFVNSSINPFLFCWCNRRIRKSVVKIVRKMMCRQTGEAGELEG